MKLNQVLLLCLLLSGQSLYSFKIDRVILSTDNKAAYIQFWPLVAKAWTEIVGIKPTLALIADDSVKIDESLGDVIRFKPIEGVTTELYAKTVRLMLPALFEDEGCIFSDIDMLPLSKDYFLDSVEGIPDDKFVVYRDGVRATGYQGTRYLMCYNAARGKTFKDLFGLDNVLEEIPQRIKELNKLGHGGDTDELVLYEALKTWDEFDTRCVFLGHDVTRRISARKWNYDPKLVKAGHYIDSHMPRPYSRNKKKIDQLARLLGLVK